MIRVKTKHFLRYNYSIGNSPKIWHRFCIDSSISSKRRFTTMKKILTLILFSLTTVLLADSELATVDHIVKNSRPADLPNIAANFSALGSTHQIKGDYANALINYKKSLQIRKAIGLDKTQGYATILFLTSIVEHKLGDSCKAAENVKKVISIYNYLGMLDDASVAEAEGLKEFKSACANLVSQN